MQDRELLTRFRDYLIAQGVVRDPRVAGDVNSNPPPLWLEPLTGVPEPGTRDDPEDHPDLVVAAFRRPGFPTGAWEGDTYRFDDVELRFRAHRPPDVYELEAAIRPLLHDRRAWDMAGVSIIESMLFLELANLGSDEQGFTFRLEYSLQRYV